MERTALERCGFLFVSFVLLILSSWQPVIYGNTEASIVRHIMAENGRSLGDHVRLLAVEDRESDRIVLFRKASDPDSPVMTLLFRKNGDGNYAAVKRGCREMYCSRPLGKNFSDFLTVPGEQTVYFAAYSEDPRLAELQIRFSVETVQTSRTISVENVPFVAIVPFQSGVTGFSANISFRDGSGTEIG